MKGQANVIFAVILILKVIILVLHIQINNNITKYTHTTIFFLAIK